MEHFNVMKEPWLLVDFLDGTQDRVSLYDAITRAHEIRCVVNEWTVNISKWIIEDFLCNFVQSVYKPMANTDEEKKKVIVDMWEKGYFDKETLDTYINDYESRGFSFDLFDEERPFLQTSKEEFDTLGSSHVVKRTIADRPLGFEWGSGQRATFWHKDNQISYEKYAEKIGYETKNALPGVDIFQKKYPLENLLDPTISEYVIALLHGTSMSVSIGEGGYNSVLPACINAVPILVMNEGKTLFQTIVASIGVSKNYEKVKSLWEKEKLKGDGPSGKTKTEFESEVKIAKNSLNHLGLYYNPTVRYYHTDSMNDLQVEKRIKSPDSESIRGASSLLSEIFPRTIKMLITPSEKKKKDGGEEKEAKKKDPYFVPLKYSPVGLGKKQAAIKTQRLTLGKEASGCAILNINLEALREEGCAKDLKTKFYCMSIKSTANPQVCERQETLEWDADKQFPSKPEAKNRLDKLLMVIDACGKTTAKYITILDQIAIGQQRQVKLAKGHIESTLEKGGSFSYSTEGVVEATRAINDALFEIEEIHYSELLKKAESIDETNEILDNLKNIVVKRFIDCFDEHRAARNSVLVKAIVRKEFLGKINEVKKSD